MDQIQNQAPSMQPQSQPPMPADWSWISQRQQSDGDAASIWKFGFIAPDGGEVRVTFHQVGRSPADKQQDPQATPPPMGDPQAAPGADQGQGQDEPSQQDQDPNAAPNAEAKDGDDSQDGQQADPSQNMDPNYLNAVNDSLGSGAGGAGAMGMGGMGAQMPGMGMAPPEPQTFAIKGQPSPDQTHDATFYVTFFSNRHPEFFMKWDTSLSHEDSLVVWVTVTHGIVDFVRKAKPTNVILDDLANGKLKMVLRSVAMDVAAANPEYTLEQTQKHNYRSFFQIKRQGAPSAFDDNVRGRKIEGDTEPHPAPGDVPQGDKTQDPTQPQPMDMVSSDNDKGHQPFPSSDPVPIQQTKPSMQTVQAKKGFTIEIGRDYSVAVKDKSGNAVDRYQGKNPADILRWINTKGYGTNQMKIVTQELPSSNMVVSESKMFIIDNNTVVMNAVVTPKKAAIMNYTVNAQQIRCTTESLVFVFATNRDMNFKRTLVELAYNQVMESHDYDGIKVGVKPRACMESNHDF
jgi:hypothetical protein